MSIVGALLIAILLSIGALHLYWGVGGRWPGHDDSSLQLRVAGVTNGKMYGFLPCAMVALALTSAAAVVGARHSEIMAGAFAWVVFAGYVTLILVFGGRGLAPYVSGAFNYARGTPFYELNRRYYAPLCLLIAALLVFNFPR